jgi:hypothetical protein
LKALAKQQEQLAAAWQAAFAELGDLFRGIDIADLIPDND